MALYGYRVGFVPVRSAFKSKGEVWKGSKFGISWIVLGLALVALLFYIVLRALHQQNAGL